MWYDPEAKQPGLYLPHDATYTCHMTVMQEALFTLSDFQFEPQNVIHSDFKHTDELCPS